MNNHPPPLKVGVVGAGNMGRNHLRVLSSMSEFELMGCFDTAPLLAAEAAERHKTEAFTSFDDLLAAVEVVHVVVPSFLHREIAEKAASAGRHVLVEKPIALTLEDAQVIIDACEKNLVQLCVGHVERFNPAIIALKDIIRHERLFAISFKRMGPFYNKATDASVVEDLMIHDLDVLNSLIDAPVKRIDSHGMQVYTDRPDYVHALLTFENGLVVDLTASRITEEKVRKIEIHAEHCYISVDYLNRSVEISRKTSFSLDIGYPAQYVQENIVEKVMVPSAEPLRSEFEHFAHCIHTGEPVATSGEMALRALEQCIRIQDGAQIECR